MILAWRCDRRTRQATRSSSFLRRKRGSRSLALQVSRYSDIERGTVAAVIAETGRCLLRIAPASQLSKEAAWPFKSTMASSMTALP
jgi:hypothetical protein